MGSLRYIPFVHYSYCTYILVTTWTLRRRRMLRQRVTKAAAMARVHRSLRRSRMRGGMCIHSGLDDLRDARHKVYLFDILHTSIMAHTNTDLSRTYASPRAQMHPDPHQIIPLVSSQKVRIALALAGRHRHRSGRDVICWNGPETADGGSAHLLGTQRGNTELAYRPTHNPRGMHAIQDYIRVRWTESGNSSFVPSFIRLVAKASTVGL